MLQITALPKTEEAIRERNKNQKKTYSETAHPQHCTPIEVTQVVAFALQSAGPAAAELWL